MDISKLKQDESLAADGVWVEMEDARFKIRSTDSKTYRKAMTKIAKRNQTRLRKDPEAIHEATIEGLADGILIDWQGIEENGQPLPCNDANKRKVLQIETIRTFLATEAQDLANFQREGQAEDAADLKSGD